MDARGVVALLVIAVIVVGGALLPGRAQDRILGVRVPALALLLAVVALLGWTALVIVR